MLSLHLLVLLLKSLHHLKNQRILMIQMFHDVADFLLAFYIGLVVVLSSEAILLRLPIL